MYYVCMAYVLCMYVLCMYSVCMYYVCMVYVCIMYVCMCITCILGTHESQERTLDVLELELQMVVSHHVGSGNKIPVLCMTALNC